MRLPFPAGVFALYGQNTMQTEAEVLTDHNELICSTSIERIVTGRDAALKQIEALIHKLDDLRLTSASVVMWRSIGRCDRAIPLTAG
jgi:hypothetical protein